MKTFTKQFIFISLAIAIILAGGVVIYGGIPQGGLKVNPILGHDLDLNALYYGQAGNNTVHDITTQDISVSAWVKLDTDGTIFPILIKAQASYAAGIGYKFYIAGAGYGVWMRINDGTNDYLVYSDTDLRDNKWHYVAGIIDRDDVNQGKVFIDGVEHSHRQGTLTASTITNAYHLSLGGNETGVLKLDGQIRDVKLYYAANDHWSDAQVLYQAQHPFDYSANAGTLTDYWRLDEGTGATLYGKPTTGNNLTLSNVLAWTTQPKLKVVNQENTTSTQNNPVGWWKMDEGTGQYAYDSSGNGNTGTLGTSTVADGADPTWTTGKLGKGLSFDGVNDYVGMGNVLDFERTSSFTVSAWVKRGATGTTQIIASKMLNSGTYRGWNVWFFSDNTIHFILRNTVETSQLQPVTANTFSSTANWYYVTVTYNGNSLASGVNFYVNGVLQAQGTPLYNNLSATTITTANFNIGSRNDGASNLFNGLIDDVRIYNRALSSSEVSQMYNSTKDGYLGKIKVSTGLVGYWKLDDNNVLTSVIDYSGKGNTGTAYSGTATSTSVLSTSTAMIGRAMSFDGVDDYVGIPANANFNFSNTNQVTWQSWIKVSSDTGGWQTVVGSITQFYFWVNIHGTAYFELAYRNTSDATQWGAIAYPFQVGTWYHIAATLNGNVRKYYVNGVYLGQVIGTGTIKNINMSARIGLISGPTYMFNGLIDEVKIWNYARSGEQIKQDYERGVKGLP